VLQGGRPGGLGGKPPKQPAPWGTTPATPQNEWATLDWGGVAKAWQPTSAVKPGAPTETSAAKPGAPTETSAVKPGAPTETSAVKPGAPTATSAGPVSFRKGGTAAGVVGTGINLPGTTGKAQGQGAVAPPPTETTGGGSDWQPPGGEMSESFRSKSGWTPVRLFRSGARLGPAFAHPKPSGTMMLKNVVPYVSTRAVLFQILHEGVSVPLLHQCDLFLFGPSMEFRRDDPGDYSRWMAIRYKEFKVFLKKPSIDKVYIRVRCSCPSEYFHFAYYAWEAGALFGTKPKRYIRKTLTYPSVNPNRYVGMCKHCSNSIVLLQRQGWLLPSPRLF
jgi:hypothetical protein